MFVYEIFYLFQQTIINRQLSFVNEKWTKTSFKNEFNVRSVSWKSVSVSIEI